METRKRPPTAPQDERSAEFQAYLEFSNSVKASGNFVGGNALQSVSMATSVRVRDGKALHTDGPFAETKEQLGGYYMVEAKDLDEATAIAARIPGAATGCIEVRPILEIG